MDQQREWDQYPWAAIRAVRLARVGLVFAKRPVGSHRLV